MDVQDFYEIYQNPENKNVCIQIPAYEYTSKVGQRLTLLVVTGVVAFAAQHEDEVLQYVGGYHGWQTLEYEVEDVCPFR